MFGEQRPLLEFSDDFRGICARNARRGSVGLARDAQLVVGCWSLVVVGACVVGVAAVAGRAEFVELEELLSAGSCFNSVLPPTGNLADWLDVETRNDVLG